MDSRAVLAALAALAQEHRLDAYRLLVAAGPDGLAAGRVAAALGILPNTLSFHFERLRTAGLVEVERRGRSLIYRADFGRMNALLAYLTDHCCAGRPDLCGLPARRPPNSARKRVGTAVGCALHEIARMGELAGRSLERAFAALERGDRQLAQTVIADDKAIDRLQREIEERAILMIARRQPMADDLRHIMGALRITGDLERVGDRGKNIAQRAITLGGASCPEPLFSGLRPMADRVLRQLAQVLAAYAQRDADLAISVWREDEQIDALYNSVFRGLLAHMMSEPQNVGRCVHLLFCARNLERIGDHTTNIAEIVHYMVRGVPLPEDRPKADTTSSTPIAPE